MVEQLPVRPASLGEQPRSFPADSFPALFFLPAPYIF